MTPSQKERIANIERQLRDYATEAAGKLHRYPPTEENADLANLNLHRILGALDVLRMELNFTCSEPHPEPAVPAGG